MTFWDHIDEMRNRMIKCILSLLFFSALSFIYSDNIIKFFLNPLEEMGLAKDIQVLSVTSMFSIKISVSILLGFMISMPILFYHIWSFMGPIFHFDNIKVFMLLLLSIFFCFVGVSFVYFIIIPNSLHFFTSISSEMVHVNYNFTLDLYISYIMTLLLGGGILFQLPVITTLGVVIGVFTSDFLKQYRPFSYILIMIISAIITPPDPISQLFIFFPLVLLYEFSIFLSSLFGKRYE